MLKFAVAGAVLVFGFAATGAPAVAAPRIDDCVDCPVSNKYDSEEVVQKIRSMKPPLANEDPIDVRPRQRGYETKRGGLLGTYGYCGPALRVRG